MTDQKDIGFDGGLIKERQGRGSRACESGTKSESEVTE